MVCLPSSKLREVQWLRAVNGHGLHRPRGSGVWGGRRLLGAGGLLQRCSVGGHWEASVLATWASPGAGPWRVGGRAPASQLAMWGLWFQGPATRAPQDATGGSGVGSVEEAGEATPSGEQPLLPHHVPRPGDMLLQWTDPTRRTPPRRARHTGAGVRRHGSAGSADIPRPPRDPRVTSQPFPSRSPGTEENNPPGTGACRARLASPRPGPGLCTLLLSRRRLGSFRPSPHSLFFPTCWPVRPSPRPPPIHHPACPPTPPSTHQPVCPTTIHKPSCLPILEPVCPLPHPSTGPSTPHP